MRCEVEGCDTEARWWVHKSGFGVRYVCSKCRDEMVAVMGWLFGGVA